MLGCELYLIDKDLGEVVDMLNKMYCDIISKKNKPLWIKIEHTKFDLHKCLPLEVNNPIAKVILWKPKGHKGTVVFANDDIYRIMYLINHDNKFDITGIMLDLDLPGEDRFLPCYYFEHWDKDKNFRLVRVMCDPRWDFYEEGERFPFEQVEKYNERIKKKRLTNLYE